MAIAFPVGRLEGGSFAGKGKEKKEERREGERERRRQEERKILPGTGELGNCLGQGYRNPQKEGIRKVVSSLSEALILKNSGCIYKRQ